MKGNLTRQALGNTIRRQEKRESLEIYIDGLSNGGAEHLLHSMLPSLEERYSIIKAFVLPGTYSLQSSFRERIQVNQVSVFHFFSNLWSSNSDCYVALSKSIFLATLACSLRNVFNKKTNITICHEHTSFEYHSRRLPPNKRIFDTLYKQLIYNCLKKNLILYVVSTSKRKKELEKEISEDASIFVFPNTFSRDYIISLTASRKRKNGGKLAPLREYRLFTLSRLEKVKQITWAIDTASQLSIDFPKVEIVLDICGKGSEEEALIEYSRKITDRRNLRINYPGFIDSIVAQLEISDVYLLPSKVEGFPLSLTEAALSGITCISNNCSYGAEELGNTFNNVEIVDPPTRENFINAVTRQLSKLVSNDDAVATSNFSTQYAEWPDIEEVTSKFVDWVSK